ncbi:Serine aminopeptidase-like protein 1 [Elsinoe fawcettii]|nr:Serine aminopeptidase-like protein 1 [Elsinoe fawcettii]
MASLLWSYARIPFFATGGLVGVLSSALYYYQNELIYPRNLPPGARTDVPKPEQFGISEYEDLRINTPDQETLHAYLVKPPNPQHSKNITLLLMHGNAGNIGHRLPIARVLSNDLACNVLMLQYRGYGLSTGDPGEKGMTIDAQTGFDYIKQRDDLKHTKLVIYGQSIGGAVAIGLAAANVEKGVAGLILENTFLSIAKMIPSVMPVAKWLVPLCHEKWPSEDYLPKITNTPILFLSGLRDEIVPPWHMKELYNLCRAKTKVWRELPHGDHNNTVAESAYFHYIDDFLRIHIMSQ